MESALRPFLVIIPSGEQGKSQEHSARLVSSTKAVGLGLVHLEPQSTWQYLSADGEGINETGTSSL